MFLKPFFKPLPVETPAFQRYSNDHALGTSGTNTGIRVDSKFFHDQLGDKTFSTSLRVAVAAAGRLLTAPVVNVKADPLMETITRGGK